tara:strand:- start:244 stop:408 length:165 start_codon:yes stop_codon:yes gene_type:complete
MSYSKNGHFYKNTVEITFKGKKKRVSQSVADAISKNPKYAPKKAKTESKSKASK